MIISIFPLGCSGVKVLFGDAVTPELNRTIQLFCQKLMDFPIKGVAEWVPAYDSVGVYYDLNVISFAGISAEIEKLHVKKTKGKSVPTRLLHIPVVYGGEYGPDLARVAAYNDCSVDEVVSLHQSQECLVYMLGFLPGFPYLGGMTPKIATPRLENPRDKIAAGSVGIADEQTGIYPVASPGGWNIIGRTPIKLFDSEIQEPILFRAGDYVKFDAVSDAKFSKITDRVKDRTYKLTVETLNGAD